MSDIKCQHCGDDTNYPPDYMPDEYRGYCPNCCVDLAEAGLLPMPTPEAMLEYITRAITARVLQSFISPSVIKDEDVKSPSTIVVTPMGPIQYSDN